MFKQRRGIIVYLQSLKQVKFLRKYGNIHYISKRLKYVVLYVDLDDAEKLAVQINKMKYVTKVEVSYKPFVKTEFESKKEERYKEELAYSIV